MPERIGSVNLTADSVVGISGRPTWVYFIHVDSGASAGTVILRNGTGTGDTAYATIDGIATSGVTENFNGGMFFPAGCFYDEDANVDFSTIGFISGTG